MDTISAPSHPHNLKGTPESRLHRNLLAGIESTQCSLRRNPLMSILCYPDINRRRRSCEPRSLCTHYSPCPRGHNSQSNISPPCSRRECRDKPAERGPSISHIFEINTKQRSELLVKISDQRLD